MDLNELATRLEALESAYRLHLGPKSGETSMNTPHSGVPYLNTDSQVDIEVIPTGTTSTTVATGNHTHNFGYYL